MEESNSKHAIQYGDYIYFHVDSTGFFAYPSQDEPLCERSDTISHLRAIRAKPSNFPSDFNLRCTFQIVGEKGQIRAAPITYGSFVRLIHQPTGLIVVASNHEDSYNSLNSYKSVYLRNSLTPFEEMAAQWQVLSRYRLRNEGDQVISSDYIVLRSFLFKRKYLTLIPPSVGPTGSEQRSSTFDSLVGLQENAFEKLGWQINHLISHTDMLQSTGAVDIMSGSFIRLNHQEVSGHLIVRSDDASLLCGGLAPLGRVCDKLCTPVTHSSGVFVRSKSVLSDPKSALGVWQLVPEVLNRPGRLKSGSGVRLRHVLTGGYLCVRPVSAVDTEALQKAATKPRNGDGITESKEIIPDGKSVTVATCASADRSTLFLIYSADVFEDIAVQQGVQGEAAYITTRENVFFVHDQTQMVLQLKRSTGGGKSLLSTPMSRSETSKRKVWEDYVDDLQLKPRSMDASVAVLSEAYRIEVLDENDVQDIIYTSRFLPLARSALSLIQFTPRMDTLFLPLYRQFNVALYTLAGWLSSQYESDGSLVLHPTKIGRQVEAEIGEEDSVSRSVSLGDDQLSDDSRSTHMSGHSHRQGAVMPEQFTFSQDVSAMNPWVGRGCSHYAKSSIPSPIPSSRDSDTASRPFVIFRQNLLSDSRLIDLLIQFTIVVFRLVGEQTRRLSDESSIQKKPNDASDNGTSQQELEAIHKVPAIVLGCCVLIHDIIHGCVYQNRRNAVRILSVNGCLLNLMDQEILGWKPPIGTLLVALQMSKLGTVTRDVDTFSTTNILSKQDIHNLLKKTYELYMRNDESAVHILELVTTLCSPGEIPNRNFQDLIAHVVFSAKRIHTDDHNSPDADTASDHSSSVVSRSNLNLLPDQAHCLLFSTRCFNKSAWEILLKVKFDISHVPTPEEVVRQAVSEEVRGLNALFNSTTGRHEFTKLTEQHAERILAALGLAGHALAEETSNLTGCTYDGLEKWWWDNRKYYFPSSMQELNQMSKEKVENEIVSSLMMFDDDSDMSELDDGVDADDTPSVPLPVLAPGTTSSVARPGVFKRLFGFRQAEKRRIADVRVPTPPPTVVLEKKLMDDAPKQPKVKPVAVAESHPLDAHGLEGEIIASVQHFSKQDAELTAYQRLRNALLQRSRLFDIGTFGQYRAVLSLKGSVSSVAFVEKDSPGVYSGLSIMLNTTLDDAKKRLLSRQRDDSNENWMNYRTCLSRASFERDWMRKTIILMYELCRGKNIYAQNKVRRLLPPDLVLELFNYGENVDKTAACSLLLNLYVDHDFVFSATAITCEQGQVLSFGEINYQPRMDAGMLFNQMTRYINPSDEITAQSLRRKLWDFVRSHLQSLSLSKVSTSLTKYNVGFLLLLRKLLSIGFFDESKKFLSESESLVRAAHENKLLEEEGRSIFTCVRGLHTEKFDSEYIERVLVKKIIECMDAHENDIDTIKRGVLGILGSDRDLGRISEDEYELINYRVQSSGSTTIGSDNIEYVDKYFMSVFGDPNQIMAFREVVSTLSLIHDMKQVHLAKKVMAMLGNPDNFFSKSLLSCDIDPNSLPQSKIIRFSSSAKSTISHLFEGSMSEKKLYSRALLAASLHQSNAIKHSVYDLLYRRQSERMDLKRVLNEMATVIYPGQAARIRLLKTFWGTVCKYTCDLFNDTVSHSSSYDNHLKEVIEFSFDAMKSLCYHSLKKRDQVGTISPRFPQDKLEVETPVDATGDDGIEMTRATVNVEDGSKKSNYNFGKPLSLLGISADIGNLLPRPSRHECHLIVGDTVLHCLEDVRKKVTSPLPHESSHTDLLPWQELSSNIKFVVNSTLDFCAAVCTGAISLIQTHLAEASDIAIMYMWSCPPAMKIATLLCRYSRLADKFHATDFLEIAASEILGVTRGNVPQPDVVGLLESIVSSGASGDSLTDVLSCVKDITLSNGAMRQYILLEMRKPLRNEIAFHVQLLRLLSSICSLQLGIYDDLLKTNIPTAFCNGILSSSSPLQVKASIINISMHLYSHGEVPVLNYITDDFKRIIELSDRPGLIPDQFAYCEASLVEYINACIEYLLRISSLCDGYNELDVKNHKNYVSQSLRRSMVGSILSLIVDSKPGLAGPEKLKSIGPVNPPEYFKCVTYLYGVIRVPNLYRVIDGIVRNRRSMEHVLTLFSAANVCHMRVHNIPKEVSEADQLQGHHLKNALEYATRLGIEHETTISREEFLRVDGIDIFVRRVGQELMPTELSRKKVLSRKREFNMSMDYLPYIPHEILVKTPLYEILSMYLNDASDFLDGGGMQLLHNSGSIKETPSLKRLCDFQKWLYGGGRYIMTVCKYLELYATNDDVSRSLLQLMCTLLDNRIEFIRSSKIPLKIKMILVQSEVNRLQRLQDTMDAFGACNLILSLVGRSKFSSLVEPFVQDIVPLGLKLGFFLLASGNDSVQDSIMQKYKEANTSGGSGGKSRYFVVSLRILLRKICDKMESYLKHPTHTFPLSNLKLLCKIYDFCASLCSGHNDSARNFLRDQDKVGESTDLVFDISKSVDMVLHLLCNQMRYITFDQFYERLGPYVWKHNPDVKRRFIAWHCNIDYELVCQLMLTLTKGFGSLTEITQGPCLKNQPSALYCTSRCMDLLEYVGAMQLRAQSVKKGIVGSRPTVWDARNPLQFYKQYERELSKLGRFNDDPQSLEIRDAIEKWSSLKKRSSRKDEFAPKSSSDILGVEIDLLFTMARECENSCLRFLLALLEASSSLVCETLIGQLDDGILLQNMENQYKLSFDKSDNFSSYRSSCTVQYLTLISTIASAQREDPEVILDDLLQGWKTDNEKDGYNTEKLVASVEITSPDGSVQRVYFPIPPFVTNFWRYPEVQKAKEALLYAVNRDSAEDKLGDFYELMQGLVQVMRRQETLRLLLTPPVHALFGGKNPIVEIFPFLKVFKMKPLFFAITLFFSIYYAYDSYREKYPWIQPHEVPEFKKMWDWHLKELVLDILKYVHMGLAAALFVRQFLNSPAADTLDPIPLPFMNSVFLIRFVSKILSFFRNVVVLAVSVWWDLALVGFSLLGFFVSHFWYAPALMDLIPQIRLMSFLLDAIARNTSRIFYTLLLAIILLYLYSVITIVFFPNQYGLAGHMACGDIISCFKLQIDYGLVNPPEWIGEGYIDPYVGKFYEVTTYGYVLSILGGTAFNFTYIILINLVLQAIISGLIIDTFGEMRAENEAIEDDIKERCFMCSIERDEFEHADIPFHEHVAVEHNMWHYVWFSIYIESKDPLTYTGPEQYVYENMVDKNGFVRLGPIKKSLSILRKAGKVKEEFTLKGVHDSLQNITTLQTRLLSATKSLSSSRSADSSIVKESDKRLQQVSTSVQQTKSDVQQIMARLTELREDLDRKIGDVTSQISRNAERIRSADSIASQSDRSSPRSHSVEDI